MRVKFLLVSGMLVIFTFNVGASDFIKESEFIKGKSITTAAPGNEKQILIKKTAFPPSMDGELNDKCWSTATSVSNFVLLKRIMEGKANAIYPGMKEEEWGKTLGYKELSPGRLLAKEQTQVYLCYDDKKLYIAFKCLESHIDKIRAEEKNRDGKAWADDCVEIFLDVNGNKEACFQFIVNCIGTTADYYSTSEKADASWNGQWDAVAKQYSDFWVVEISIPFSTLGINSPVAGERWGVNFGREECPSGELSTTAFLYSRFAEIEKYDELVFEALPVYTLDAFNPGEYGIGINNAIVKVSNNSSIEKQLSARLTVGNKTFSKERIILSPNSFKEINIDYELPEKGKYKLSAILCDSSDNSKIFGRKSTEIDVSSDIVSVILSQKEYYTDDKSAKIGINLNAGSVTLGNSILKIILCDSSGKELRGGTVDTISSKELKCAVDISNLGIGVYEITVYLNDKKGGVISKGICKFSKIKGMFD